MSISISRILNFLQTMCTFFKLFTCSVLYSEQETAATMWQRGNDDDNGR